MPWVHTTFSGGYSWSILTKTLGLVLADLLLRPSYAFEHFSSYSTWSFSQQALILGLVPDSVLALSLVLALILALGLVLALSLTYLYLM